MLEPGKHSGPIVTDLQGKLNMWRERQWNDLQGRPGWLTSGLDLKGKFDRQTVQALKEFQASVGLPATGVADAATQNLLKIESDPHCWRATTQTQRAEVRKLIGSIDAVHADAVVKLLDSNAFRSHHTDQTRAVAALVASRGDPTFAASLKGCSTTCPSNPWWRTTRAHCCVSSRGTPTRGPLTRCSRS